MGTRGHGRASKRPTLETPAPPRRSLRPLVHDRIWTRTHSFQTQEIYEISHELLVLVDGETQSVRGQPWSWSSLPVAPALS